MASTARDEAGKKEFFDSEEVLDKKVTQLAELILKSDHFVVFTGAGISTSTGIPDFRSGVNTVLETGAGAWEKAAALKQGIQVKAAKKKVSTLQAIPSITHMSFVALLNPKNNPNNNNNNNHNNKNKEETALLKHVISQNTDGLHRRSGIHPNNLSELHGNSKLEICTNTECGKEYLRDYRVRYSKNSVHKHETLRNCDKCHSKLKDTIINFGENLPDKAWNSAQYNSEVSDLCLAMGSSLTVTPAADLPKLIGKKGYREINSNKNNNKKNEHNLCIVNLQRTPLDKYCQLRIFAKCDDVMTLLMKKLNIKIPKWCLTRFVRISIKKIKDDKDNNKECLKIQVNGIDSDETPASIFRTIKLTNETKKNSIPKKYDELTHQATFTLNDWYTDDTRKPDKLSLEFGFMKHYNEPNCVLQINDLVKQWQQLMNADNGNKNDKNEEKENHNDNNENMSIFEEDCEFAIRMEYDVCETQQWIVKPIQEQVLMDDIIQKLNNIKISDKNDQ